MAPHPALLQGLGAREILDAIDHVASENPDLKIVDLEARLSELWQLNPRDHGRRPRTQKATDNRDDGNDGDDELEDDEHAAHASLLPTLPSSDPSPPQTLLHRSKGSSPAAPKAFLTATSINPQLCVKGSDGIRDKNTGARGNSVLGGIPLADVKASIQAAIPSHTIMQQARIKQKKFDHAASRRRPSPRTPPSRGSPKPWPRSPQTPTDKSNLYPQDEPRPGLMRSHTAPHFPTRFRSLRNHSESPERSRTRFHRQRARLSAPLQTAPFETEPESGKERGRTRVRRSTRASRPKDHSQSRGRSPAFTISNPMLQHPILVPGLCVGAGSPGLQGSSRRVTPSPLANEQKASASSPDEVRGCEREATQRDGAQEVYKQRRRAVILGGRHDADIGEAGDGEISLKRSKAGK